MAAAALALTLAVCAIAKRSRRPRTKGKVLQECVSNKPVCECRLVAFISLKTLTLSNIQPNATSGLTFGRRSLKKPHTSVCCYYVIDTYTLKSVIRAERTSRKQFSYAIPSASLRERQLCFVRPFNCPRAAHAPWANGRSDADGGDHIVMANCCVLVCKKALKPDTLCAGHRRLTNTCTISRRTFTLRAFVTYIDTRTASRAHAVTIDNCIVVVICSLMFHAGMQHTAHRVFNFTFCFGCFKSAFWWFGPPCARRTSCVHCIASYRIAPSAVSRSRASHHATRRARAT